jgi:hypothetical protein
MARSLAGFSLRPEWLGGIQSTSIPQKYPGSKLMHSLSFCGNLSVRRSLGSVGGGLTDPSKKVRVMVGLASVKSPPHDPGHSEHSGTQKN